MKEYIQKNAKYIAALLVGILATLLKQYLNLDIPVGLQDFIIVGLTAYVVKRIANTTTLSTGEKVNVADIKEVVDAKVEQAKAENPYGMAPPWKKPDGR